MYRQSCILLIAVMVFAVAPLSAGRATDNEFEGTLKAGYVYIGDEGNRGVQQPTYNLYEGVSLSLEDFSYRYDFGTRLFADVRNITLNSRQVVAGVSQPGFAGVTLRHNQYRRIYSFEGDRFTRRRQTTTQAWVRPISHVRIFGGYGETNKNGRSLDYFDPLRPAPSHRFRYDHRYFNAGAQLTYGRSVAGVEIRQSRYLDEDESLNDRDTERIRVTVRTPVPRWDFVVVNGGFQRFVNRLPNRADTLLANTGWGGVQVYYGDGFQARYSFLFDRARRHGDLTATDNVVHAIDVGRTWQRRGGLTIGYRYRVNDDYFDETETNGVLFSGWIQVIPDLMLRAAYGAESRDVPEGHTLTGDADVTKAWAQARYRYRYGWLRLKVANRETDNEDIGSSAGFLQVSSDVTFALAQYGDVDASYALLDGEYQNTGGRFEFVEHIVTANVLTAPYKGGQVGVGGTYARSLKDLDVESFLVRLIGKYALPQSYRLEVVYSAFNFDDFDDPGPMYTRYYTSNVVEVYLSRSLGK